ncbi:MAG: hypothetical protein FJY36_02920 [Betaproteobacteria bacterium]|nr:hypothetical protein [Betaproteobacteria bacterium]
MRPVLTLMRSRVAAWLGVCGLVLMQAACAHPVVLEPSVVVQGRIGGPVYGEVHAGPMYGSAPVLVAPPPVVLPPRTVWLRPAVVAPRAWLPPGHHRHHHHRWHGHGSDRGWTHWDR